MQWAKLDMCPSDTDAPRKWLCRNLMAWENLQIENCFLGLVAFTSIIPIAISRKQNFKGTYFWNKKKKQQIYAFMFISISCQAL